ncbi:hypothetical protein RRG08_044306 [Elysia crispata]|uniref:Uncharacterized protein n=1 Tax=Elysia crispata TaxID=231223 RepID=A0AAE0XXW7_9GAST|nr:hypothetical protein RRG08_044306 [Elysia crispata]
MEFKKQHSVNGKLFAPDFLSLVRRERGRGRERGGGLWRRRRRRRRRGAVQAGRGAGYSRVDKPGWTGRGGEGRGVSGTVASLVSCLSRTPRPRRGLKALWARGSQYFPGAVCSDSAVPACYSARLGAASWPRR